MGRREEGGGKREEMIIAIVGRRGQGKSALGTYRALQAYKKDIPLYANYALKIPYHQYVGMEYIKNGCVILDEGYLYADSRKSMSNANVFLSYELAQCRKNHNTLYFITQQSSWLDLRIRDNFDMIDVCRAYTQYGQKKIFDHEKIGFVLVTRIITAVEPFIVSGYRFNPSRAGVFDYYDPYELVEKEKKNITPEQRKDTAINLYEQGMRQKDIAKILGVSVSSVKTYLKEYKQKEREGQSGNNQELST
jgi:hypothetical protein